MSKALYGFILGFLACILAILIVVWVILPDEPCYNLIVICPAGETDVVVDRDCMKSHRVTEGEDSIREVGFVRCNGATGEPWLLWGDCYVAIGEECNE